MTPRAPDHQVIRASAGSGKTHQLTNHYLRLLADGVEPESILATTFTRKAAGEILDRVLERLAAAAAAPDEATRLAADLGLPAFGPADFVALLRRSVRNLGRLRVGTLDGFCVGLAGCFGAELGLPPAWTIGDEVDEAALRRDALEQLLERAPDHVQTLLPLLSKGAVGRSVHAGLLEVVDAHYETYQGAARPAWERLQVPEPVPAAERAKLLAKLRAFDFSACGHKGFGTARDKDVANCEREDWPAFVVAGLAGKVLAGETTYYKKGIPAAAVRLYHDLLRHARSQILGALAGQTRATWDLLDRFHRELWALKQRPGSLQFGEVTQALADGMAKAELTADAIAYRLGGRVDHLLLDEFQDTSLGQWHVLRPIAQRITKGRADPPQSFFCVGDVKQAIYGWRGGMAEIFDTLNATLGQLNERSLAESRRSAPPVIEVVNAVFGSLDQVDAGSKCEAGLAAWRNRFKQHTTARKEISGYVGLFSGPAQADGQSVGDQRGRHCVHVAGRIRDLTGSSPGRSVGVLCRRTDTVARMIYELRRVGVAASEEAGSSVTDSPAVELVLAVFALADHPGHSAAWFHLANSPLKERLAPFADADSAAQRLRRDLLTKGYGPFTHDWANHVAPACDARDLSRLQQLVELAYDYQPRGTLRADDFTAWVRQQRVPDPSGASVRVMTIHAAKGLQFDAVVLPELDPGLLGLSPTLVVGRDPQTLNVDFVCRYANETVQGLLAPEDRRAFQQDAQRRVEESLSLLYVAMTRAMHALHLYIPGPRDGKSDRKDAWYKLLRQTLAPKAEWSEHAIVAEWGDRKWFERLPTLKTAPEAKPEPPVQITFQEPQADRRRGLEHVAPSRRENQTRMHVRDVLEPANEVATAVGQLFHAWFATVAWLDDGEPTAAELTAAAYPLRAELPEAVWRNVGRHMAEFRLCLQRPAVSAVLQRSAYASPGAAGFPAALAPLWNQRPPTLTLERERRFLVPDAGTLLSGSIDRLVWLRADDGNFAADVLDFKTDAVAIGAAAALAARREYHQPQIESYRRAVARMARLPEDRVAARLVFTTGAVEVLRPPPRVGE